jgi:hypothetical protein
MVQAFGEPDLASTISLLGPSQKARQRSVSALSRPQTEDDRSVTPRDVGRMAHWRCCIGVVGARLKLSEGLPCCIERSPSMRSAVWVLPP